MTTTPKIHVVGDAKQKLMERIEAFCSQPRSYAAIVKHGKVSDSQTRYVLRQLMIAGRMLKAGSRENTVYAHFRPLPATKKSAKKPTKKAA